MVFEIVGIGFSAVDLGVIVVVGIRGKSVDRVFPWKDRAVDFGVMFRVVLGVIAGFLTGRERLWLGLPW